MFLKTSRKILGINARNLLYIRAYNPKQAIMRADSKLATKQFLSARNIAVPKMITIIRNYKDLKKFDFTTLPDSFVLKPNSGYGGEGIIVIVNRDNEYFIKPSGEKISQQELALHIRDILDGRFSLSSKSDIAFFEQIIITHESLAPYAVGGLPDIRVIVHNLVPIMAMLRLPTAESDGKANLHLGAIGVGIDLAKGTTTYATHYNHIIKEIPNIGKVSGIKIPFWEEILLIASRSQLATNLGYLAADIVLDQNIGPVLLEINARAGLAVQVANLSYLRERLERVKGLKVPTPEKGVRIAQDLFGEKLPEKDKLANKIIVGSYETVELILRNGIHRVTARISLNTDKTFLDESIVENIRFGDEERRKYHSVRIKFAINGKKITTLAHPQDFSDKKYKMLISYRDLGSDFLIDPTKNLQVKKMVLPKEKKIKKISSDQASAISANLIQIDQSLAQIDEEIHLLSYLRPINLTEEKAKFFKNFRQNPVFKYRVSKKIINQSKLLLNKLNFPESDLPFKILLEEKKAELNKKLDLISVVGSTDFSDISKELYLTPDQNFIIEAEKKAREFKQVNFQTNKKLERLLSLNEIKIKMEDVLQKYDLKDCQVRIKKEMLANCQVLKNGTILLSAMAKISEEHLIGLIAHEIETHLLRTKNGEQQPYKIFAKGFANYLMTEEGLAIYNQERILSKNHVKNFYPALNALAVVTAQKESFLNVFEMLLNYGVDSERAWITSVKVKRGISDTSASGAFTKDGLYFIGRQKIDEFIKSGGDLRKLYIGKVGIETLPLIEKIEEIKEPKYLPEYLKAVN